MKYKIESNQYIPHNARRLASGMPACATYYYIVNDKGQVVDKTTLKPYRGKQMNRYAIHSEEQANQKLIEIKQWEQEQ